MLVHSSRFINCPVMSVQLSGMVARVVAEIVDPDTLKIAAFLLNGPTIGDGETGSILAVSDVREFGKLGLIVDSADVFVNPGDVAKLDKIMQLNFSLIDLKVKTKSNQKLGKVVDFVVSTPDFSVQQLIVKRPALRSFMNPELTIARSQILEIDDYTITVKDSTAKVAKTAPAQPAALTPDFVNPFRSTPKPAPQAQPLKKSDPSQDHD